MTEQNDFPDEVKIEEMDDVFDDYEVFDDPDTAKTFKEALEKALDSENRKIEIYTQVDSEISDDRLYARGIRVINRTGIYAVVWKWL